MATWTDIHTSKRFRFLTEKQDPNGNIYVYLQGVGSTVANDWVTFDEAGVTTRLTTSAKSGAPLAIAQAATDATTEYGWYGVVGSFTGNCVDGGGNDDNEQAYASGTTAAATAVADNDAKLEGVIFRSNDNSTALTATFQMSRGAHFSHDLST